MDFGVFVCSNCSGAHRALGPTITRIKSTKLDQWNTLWLENMQIGNREVNSFWEADAEAASLRYEFSNPGSPKWELLLTITTVMLLRNT